MGHLEKSELLDVVRHEMRLDDEDGNGLCSRLLLNVTRRPKHGGLPLKFGESSKEDCEESFDGNYEIPLYEEPLHTQNIINERIAQRTEQKIKEEKRVEHIVYDGPLDELFVPVVVKWPPPPLAPDHKSAVDVYLETNAASLDNPLSEYRQFAATPDMPSKSIMLIYPMENQGFRSIQIGVVCTARVREVVGYAMLQYLLEFNEELCGSVDDYQLFLADEDGEIERDFPPLDSSKIIGTLGFECLGLINRQQSGSKIKKKAVIVWFLEKDQYVIEVDNLEKPLKWLRDEAIRLRDESRENFEDQLNDGIVRTRDYYLETVDRFDVKLDLEATISSARSSEFVMIRKNSARAGFHPRGARYGRQMSAMMTLKMPNSPIPAAPTTPLPTVVEKSEQKNLSPPTLAWSDQGGQLSCFYVMRTHRFKPKWKAKLLIRWTCFEIERHSLDKAAFLPQGYQKPTKVPWEFMGGLKVQKKDAKPGRVNTWQITFFWLPVLSNDAITEVVGDNDEWNLRHVARLYRNEDKWRQVSIETSRSDDVEQIESQMRSILSARDAAIHKAFLHSSMGTRAPAASADLAVLECAEGPIVSPIDDDEGERVERVDGKMRRVSRILITPFANVIRKNTRSNAF